MDLREYVRDIPDFPHDGIMFRDITPLLVHPGALDQAVEQLAAACAELEPIDYVVAAEARGFILGAAIAAQAGCGFVPARRPGKLPPETLAATYVLEYGENVLEMHPDLIPIGARVVIHDDVLATGGTVDAICGLIERIGGEVVGACFIIELGFLGARDRLAGLDLYSLITY